MTNEQEITTTEVQRDAEQVVRKPNFELLSEEFNETPKSENTELVEVKEEVKVNEPIETEIALEEDKKEETKVEEVKEVVEENELKLDDELSVEDIKEDEIPEDSWIALAKSEGLEVTEDSFEAVKEAITKPLLDKIAEIDSKKMEDYFVDLDPKIRMQIELNKAGMSLDEINAPLENIAKFKALSPVELYREDLIARYPSATPEWIDADVEKMISIDGAIEHEAARITMELDAIEKSILADREQLIEKYKVNKDNFLQEKRRNELESVSKSLNEIDNFMGSKLPQEVKSKLSERLNNGKYDQLLNDPTMKAKFIAFVELGEKALKNIEAKSYNKGKLEWAHKLANTPPLDKGAAGHSMTQNVEGNFEKLNNDTFLND